MSLIYISCFDYLFSGIVRPVRTEGPLSEGVRIEAELQWPRCYQMGAIYWPVRTLRNAMLNTRTSRPRWPCTWNSRVTNRPFERRQVDSIVDRVHKTKTANEKVHDQNSTNLQHFARTSGLGDPTRRCSQIYYDERNRNMDEKEKLEKKTHKITINCEGNFNSWKNSWTDERSEYDAKDGNTR